MGANWIRICRLAWLKATRTSSPQIASKYAPTIAQRSHSLRQKSAEPNRRCPSEPQGRFRIPNYFYTRLTLLGTDKAIVLGVVGLRAFQSEVSQEASAFCERGFTCLATATSREAVYSLIKALGGVVYW